MAIKLGERVEVPCVAISDPPPTYTWKKDDKDLKMGLDIRQVPGSGTIIIEEPGRAHEGVYQCFASNSFGTAISTKILLKKAVLETFPTVRDPKVHRPKVGSSLILLCHPPLSYPQGIIYWGENNHSTKLKPIDNTERVSLDYHGTLYFSNIEPEDDRKGFSYVCIQQNIPLRSLAQGDDQKIEPQSIAPEKPKPVAPALMWSSPSQDVALKDKQKKK